MMSFGTSGPHGKSMKCSTLGFRGSKVMVTQGQSKSQKCISARHLTNFNQTRQAHIMVYAYYVTAVGMLKVEGQGQGIILDAFGSISFSSCF